MRINDKKNYNKIRNNITMNNLRKIIKKNNYSVVKVAMNSRISEATINAYTSNQKIPSLPTLISMANYLNCNMDYLVDRTNNPVRIKNLDEQYKDEETAELVNSIENLSSEKRALVRAYIQGLNSIVKEK